MGLKEWKLKYYSIDAFKVKKKDALAHSLKKWEGLRPSVLERYGVIMVLGGLSPKNMDADGTGLYIDADSCALCTYYLLVHSNCTECPLARIRGGIRCDFRRPRETMSPYTNMMDDGNPLPMLRWLRKALKKEQGT